MKAFRNEAFREQEDDQAAGCIRKGRLGEENAAN